MADKHTVHLREGGRVVIKGSRVELHLKGPLVFHRQSWVKYLMPAEEASRAIRASSTDSDIASKLSEAFSAVPMVVHHEDGD